MHVRNEFNCVPEPLNYPMKWCMHFALLCHRLGSSPIFFTSIPLRFAWSPLGIQFKSQMYNNSAYISATPFTVKLLSMVRPLLLVCRDSLVDVLLVWSFSVYDACTPTPSPIPTPTPIHKTFEYRALIFLVHFHVPQLFIFIFLWSIRIPSSDGKSSKVI